MRSPLNYLGGKSRLSERIVKVIPTDHLCYCEPFCGAAWVLFAKEPSKVEVINDADGELVTLWRVVQNHLEEFLRYYRFSVVSREIFDLETRKDPSTLTDIQRATRYFYLQKTGFGGHTHNRTFGTGATQPSSLNLNVIEERLLEVHWRLKRVTIEHLDAIRCIQKYDRATTFFYIDPPYWNTQGYAVKWTCLDFIRLRKVLDKVVGRFILSLNDVPDVRRLFAGFNMRSVKLSYSCANGRQENAGRNVARSELLIRNF